MARGERDNFYIIHFIFLLNCEPWLLLKLNLKIYTDELDAYQR